MSARETNRSAELKSEEAAATPTRDGGDAAPSAASPEAQGQSATVASDDHASRPQAEERVRELEQELEAVRRERDEYLDLARRKQAEFENFRRRMGREKAEAGVRAKADLIRDLLPQIDNLERALAAAAPDDPLAEGVRMIHRGFLAALEQHGVEPFDPRGERFDPTLHDALSTRAEEGTEPGVVVDVVEKGYRLGELVIRPARVIVSA